MFIIAAAAHLSTQNIAFNEVARQAIRSDQAYRGGRYYDHNETPVRGLMLARMLGHITYMSDDIMERRFGRDLQHGELRFGLDTEFEVESYLHHQGQSFVDRFDANSYMLITKVLDYFDPAKEHGGDLAAALAPAQARFVIFSFNSDWRFPSARSREIVDALIRAKKPVQYLDIRSTRGHDSFLQLLPEYHEAMCTALADAGAREPLPDRLRSDQLLIQRWIKPGTRILDLGCGDGELLAFLQCGRSVTGYGLEIDPDSILHAMRQGVHVIHYDLDADGLSRFADNSFDCVLMAETLQAVRYPQHLLTEMLRVGSEGVVTFSHFGHWRCRLRLIFGGRMPQAPGTSSAWHDSPRIHPCTMSDFEALCREAGIVVLNRVIVDRAHRSGFLVRLLPSLFGESVIYRLRRRQGTET